MAGLRSSKFVLEITVFVCGALVMIYEVTGSRLLAPYIGTSTYVWTSLIGVILAALSVGYWLGGKAADIKPDAKILASVIFGAGGAVSVTILLKDLVLSIVAGVPAGLEVKSILAALLLFAPASVLLGFVTPYAVKLKLARFEDAGKTVGRLYALSTVGSIFGTFAAGFIFIPFVGSTKTLYLIGASLIALSLLLAPFALTKANLTAVILFVFGVFTSETFAYLLYRQNGLHDIDTEYSRVRVFTTTDEATGRKIRALTLDPHSFQSKMFLDSDELAAEYTKYYHLVRHFKPDFQNALMIGGAGYSFPKDYLAKYPGKPLETVEIDPQMTEIARRFFNLRDDANHKIIHEDGRIFLNRSASGKYDAVLMDAFGSLFSVPFQLTTVEAAREINRVLKPDGIVIFNIGGALSGKSSRFLHAELNTYRQVFPQVLLFKVKDEKPENEVQNFIIVALKSNNSFSQTSPDAEIGRLLQHQIPMPDTSESAILTDELAPVEYFNSN